MEKFKSIVTALIKQILIVFLYILLTVSLQLLLYNYITSSNNIIQGISYTVIYIVILIVFILLFRKIFIPDLIDFKKNGKEYIKNCYKYWLYGLLVMAISNIIISNYIGMVSNEVGNRELLNNLPISSILSMVVFSPIIEELMTRVILKDKFPAIVYYTLSGLIFGSLHLIVAQSIYELFYIIPYGALGYSFAVIYNKYDNVCTNMFFHSLHNTLAILLIILF